MSDNYSDEIKICNLLKGFLQMSGYKTIQLIYPGGQATFSLSYVSSLTSSKKTIYPDLIAIDENKIIIGEVKPNYSNEDKVKLLDLMHSEDGEHKIRSLISRIIKSPVDDFNLKYILIHGKPCKHDPEIEQLILSENESYFI